MTIFSKISLIGAVTTAVLFTTACSDANSSERASSPAQQAAKVVEAEISQTGNWNIQAADSHIRFTAEQEGKPFTGSFGAFSGIIDFDPAKPEAGSVKIEIPLSGVDAGSKDRNSTLPAKTWFSTKAFPTAVFTSNDLTRDGEGYLAKGSLTLKGQTVDLDLPFNLSLDGDRAVMTSEISLDRTKWNVGAAPWDTDEWVSRGVSLDIQVTAEKIQ